MAIYKRGRLFSTTSAFNLSQSRTSISARQIKAARNFRFAIGNGDFEGVEGGAG